MKLYEVTNGMMGTSYVRCYVWAADPQQAKVLADLKNPGEFPANGIFSERTVATELLDSADKKVFATKSSDEGWQR